ncbi:hypothetical protein H0H93_004594 [Arthromyces matolae]|nr:hypothetical protein H0H93_004594 [Arthromyces matolae]
MYVKIHLANQHVLEGYEGTTETEVRSQTSQNLYALRWGPTKVPIYNLLGLFSLINPEQRTDYLKIARFLIDEFKVPVDGADLSGTTALSHCFSTKPGFDLEYAQMLYDAGGDVNHRNRYGCTVAQEICQVFLKNDREAVRKAKESFKWFLSHGGNVDIEDTDGFTVRRIVGMSIRELQVVLAEEDKRRKAKGDSCCAFCGREDLKLMSIQLSTQYAHLWFLRTGPWKARIEKQWSHCDYGESAAYRRDEEAIDERGWQSRILFSTIDRLIKDQDGQAPAPSSTLAGQAPPIAAILIADVGRAFPVPFATKDGNIDGVKVATRHDESFVDPQTIQVREEQGFPSLPIVLRSIDVPSIAEIQARSADHRVVLPDLPPPFVLLRNAIRNGTERALQVHQYDLEPEVSTFRLPPPPFLDRYREKLEEHLKGHLFTLLREARQSTHSRIRIMQLWVLITAYDLIQLGWQPYGYPFHGLFVARKYALEGSDYEYEDEDSESSTESEISV